MLIRVSNTINVKDLFTEAEVTVDAVRSAARLVEQTSSEWRSFLGKTLPAAQVEIRVRLNDGERTSANIVFVEFDEPVSHEIRNYVSAQLNEIALGVFTRSDWVVAAAA